MREVTAGLMVALPWAWVGPTKEKDEHGNVWYELRVEELPDFFVAAESEEAAIAEAGAALESFLESYLKTGEAPPLPKALGTAREVPEQYRTGLEKTLQAA
jgi:predicted RNase H-like HicB family nuclease